MTTNGKDSTKVALCVALFTSFSLAFFAPLEMYLTNIDSFWFTYDILLPFISIVFIIFFILLFLLQIICSLLSKHLGYTITVLIIYIGFTSYIQGNYIPSSNGILDGTVINWHPLTFERLASDICWLTLLILSAIVILNYKRISFTNKISNVFSAISICITLVEITTLVFLFTSNPEILRKDTRTVTIKDEFLVSNSENFFILVLDSFDSSLFSNILKTQNHSVYDDFDGFTYYPDTLGCYGHTDLALPQLITGQLYYNEEAYGQYLKKAFNDSDFLCTMKENNWNMGIYTTNILPSCEMVDYMTNTTTNEAVTFSSKRRFLQELYQLIAYRYSPYEFKKPFWFYPDFESMKYIKDQELLGYNWSIIEFYEGLSSLNTSYSEGAFRLYHVQGTHVPWHINQDATYSDDLVGEEDTAKGNLVIVNSFINKLKELDIYDNSIIVILADHGFSNNGDGYAHQFNQNPLLLIKGKNERHSLNVSDKPLSYYNLQAIYINLLQGYDANTIIQGFSSSNRYFNKYDWDYTRQTDMFFPQIHEYKLTGHASNINDLVPTNNVYIAPTD